MPLTDQDRSAIERFRDDARRRYAGDARFGPSLRHDRDDGAALADWFPIGDQLWLEICLRPTIPQLRAGIVTDDRWKSEDLEQVIEDSGDTMSEFVEMGFDEAGLNWSEPPVEHFRDQGKYFYFATGFELKSLAELDSQLVRDKLHGIFEGYYLAFRPALTRPG